MLIKECNNLMEKYIIDNNCKQIKDPNNKFFKITKLNKNVRQFFMIN